MFAEAAARVVADGIAAQLPGTELDRAYEGDGHCSSSSATEWSERSRSTSSATRDRWRGLLGPSRELAAEKEEFASSRRERWFAP